MRVRVFGRSLATSDAQRAFVQRKIGAALRRVRRLGGTADVRLADLNGPKGGVDQACTVVLTPPGLRTIRIEERAADSYAAVERAARRLRRTVARILDRRKTNGSRHEH
jgi:putative sigma-54 modulation protein